MLFGSLQKTTTTEDTFFEEYMFERKYQFHGKTWDLYNFEASDVLKDQAKTTTCARDKQGSCREERGIEKEDNDAKK